MCLYTTCQKYDAAGGCRYSTYFYNLQKNKNIGKPLSRTTPTAILRRRLKQIRPHWTKDDMKRYASNSLRKAGVTAALSKGADRLVVQRHGGWKSAQSLNSYYAHDIDAEARMMDSILNDTDARSDSDSDDDDADDAGDDIE